MDFKQNIKQFQENGDMEIIDKIVNYAKNIDFTKNPTRRYLNRDEMVNNCRVVINLQEPEMYIAYRIRFFLEKIGNKVKYYEEDDFLRYYNLTEYLDNVRSWWGLDRNVEGFDDILALKYNKNFKRYLGVDYYTIFEDIEYFMQLNKKIRQEKQKIQDQLTEKYIIPALKYALSKVDCSKTDKEIVKYVNKAFLSYFITAQNKDKGLKRIQRKIPNKDKTQISKHQKSFYVQFKYRPVLYMVFNRRVGEYLLPYIYKLLQQRQVDFLQKLIKAVEEEVKANNKKAFKMDINGESILNYRYFANKLNMEESAFKHKIRRIRKKVEDNWDKIGYQIPRKNTYFYI